MNTVLEVIIDYSDSMGNGKQFLLPDGSTRMHLAKKALIDDIIPALDYTGKIGIRRFHSISTGPVIKDVYVGDFSREVVINEIRGLPDPVNTGGTPISEALQRSIEYLKKFPAADRKIILVTDGEESGNGDFRKTAADGLKEHGVECNIFIVGIGQNAGTYEKCKQFANSTNGGYINLQTKDYNKAELSDALRTLSFKAVSSTITNIQNQTHKTITQIQGGATQEIEAKPNNSELLKLLSDHTRSIDLLNKQLNNLDNGLKSVSDKGDLCLQKLGAINLSEQLNKLQATYKSDLAQVHQSQQATFTQFSQDLNALGQQVQQITVSDLQQRIKDSEDSILETLNKIETSMERRSNAINSHTRQVVDSLYFEGRIRGLEDKLSVAITEMIKLRNVAQSVEANTSVLLSRQAKEAKFWRILVVIGMVAVFSVLAYLLFRYRHNIL